MINLGLFFERSLQIGGIFFDGHVSENASFPLEMTSSPVEYGANVVDNAVVQPFVLNVSAFVSETPGYSLDINGIFNNFKRTSDALDVLRQLQSSRMAVDVYCNTGLYQNMMITEIRPTSDMSGITTISIDITMQQIIFVGETNTENPFDNQYRNEINRGNLEPSDLPI